MAVDVSAMCSALLVQYEMDEFPGELNYPTIMITGIVLFFEFLRGIAVQIGKGELLTGDGTTVTAATKHMLDVGKLGWPQDLKF